jgi:molecular chaperone HscA
MLNAAQYNDAGERVRQLMFVEKFGDEVGRVFELRSLNTGLHSNQNYKNYIMALLQIAEPGMSTAPHQHRLAVGIDLGTTNSLVATVRHGIPEVLNDEEGHALLPSIVHYLPNGYATIGYKAQAAQTTDPKNTIVSVKRFMGRGLKDIAHAENLPYDFIDAPGMVQLKTVAGIKSPVEVSAEILATLRQRAEDALGDELVGAVITVPAYFDDAQRQATKDAASWPA